MTIPRNANRVSISTVDVGAEYAEDQAELLRAAERYREDRHLRFLKAIDYLEIVKSLGYSKPISPSQTKRRRQS
jgi:hypothetical protein